MKLPSLAMRPSRPSHRPIFRYSEAKVKLDF
jgi:hypothetical protein